MSEQGPTIRRRMQPGFIIITTDDRLGGELQAAAGENWQVAVFPAPSVTRSVTVYDPG